MDTYKVSDSTFDTLQSCRSPSVLYLITSTLVNAHPMHGSTDCGSLLLFVRIDLDPRITRCCMMARMTVKFPVEIMVLVSLGIKTHKSLTSPGMLPFCC